MANHRLSNDCSNDQLPNGGLQREEELSLFENCQKLNKKDSSVKDGNKW